MTLANLGRSVAIATGLLLCVGEPAHAQSAEAESLFRDGRALLKAGKLQAGCDKLDASEKLESSVGTLLNLGDCREKLGRHASAWAAFRKAEAMAKRAGGDTKRMLEAKKRADRLEGKLSRLVIHVERPVAGLVVKRDDELVEAPVWGTAVPVDPDTYTIVAEAPGHTPWRTQVILDTRTRRKVVVVPPLARAPVTAQPPPAAAIQARPPVEEPVTTAPPPPPMRSEPPTVGIVTRRSGGTWSNTRRASVVIGLAGLGAIGGGVYYGLEARDLQDRSDELCPLVTCTDAEGLRLNDDAKDAARRANILYGLGGAAIVTSVVMWVVGAPAERTVIVPAVGSGHAGVSLSGSF